MRRLKKRLIRVAVSILLVLMMTVGMLSLYEIVRKPVDGSYAIGSGGTPAHEHNWDSGYVEVRAGCLSQGQIRYTCLTCGQERISYTNPLGHSTGSTVIENRKDATCTSDGYYEEARYCARCSTELSRVRKTIDKGHSMTLIPATESTTTSFGNTEYWRCSMCGKCFSDSEGNHEISLSDTVIDKKPLVPDASCSHEWDSSYTVDRQPTCSKAGTCSIHCIKCGMIREGSAIAIPKAIHSFGEWVITKEATETDKGQKIRTCAVCGEKDTYFIPQLSPSLKAAKAIKPAASRKSAIVKWKKVSGAQKIEIQYSRDKSFKTGTKTKYANAKKKSFKIKGLKSKKKYYIRIRAYTSSGGAVHVSKWSAVKSVKAK